MSTGRTPQSWKLRKWFWSHWQTFRLSVNKPQNIGAPQPNKKTIKAIPLKEKYSEIPLDILVYDQLPPDEAKLGMRIFVSLQLFLNRLFPAMQPGLPEIDPDINVALGEALTSNYRKIFPVPVLPPNFKGEGKPELEDLAVESPYSLFLERDSDGVLHWDFRELGEFEHQEGLCSLATRVVFKENAEPRRLVAEEIWSQEYGVVTRGDEQWNRAKNLAICAATTHTALIRHFDYVHLITGNHWDIATRNHLPSDHPLYRLLWPSILNSLYTNHGVTRVQMLPDGDFVNMYSFTHSGLMRYSDAMYKKYSILMIDPETDWQRRGLADSQFDCPSQENLLELFKLMHDHAKRYVYAYYDSDEALQADRAVQEWLSTLNEMIPNGLGDFLGDGVTRDRLARLIGAYIYEGNTIHDLVGTTLWDFQLWVDRNPIRIYRDGRRIPLDVLQRAINNNFALQLKRAPLLADYGDVALDENGAALFNQFFQECQALQNRYDQTPTGPWRMEPKNLEISMNG